MVIPFVLQISAAAGLTGWLSLRNGQQAVDNLVAELESEVSDRIEQHLDNYLDVPRQINASNHEAVRLGLLDINDAEQLSRTFWQQIRIHETLSYIYFAKEADGGYVDAGRQSDGQLVIEQTRDYVAGDFMIFATDSSANRTELLSVDPDYDPRVRPWYTSVANQRYPRWSEIYAMFPDNILAVTATQPVHDDDGTFLGVFAVDLTLSRLTVFLRQLQIGESGQAAIIERSGDVVALSSQENPFSQPDPEVEPDRIALADVESSMLSAAAIHLQESFDNFDNIHRTQQLEFQLEGERQYLQVTPYSNEMGLDWLIIVALPESDFMTQIHESTRQTVALSLVALTAAIAFGVYTSSWIARPIRRFNRASQAIAEGNLDQAIEPQPIREMDTLAVGFNHMTATLNELIQELERANDELEARVENRTTELREALDQLQQTQLKLVQTEKMSSLSQLVAGVAHEINNPIGVIRGNLDHASDYVEGLLNLLHLYEVALEKATLETASPPIKESRDDLDVEFVREDFPQLLKSMKSSTSRIQSIVESLRNFARLDEAQIKQVNLHEGLDSALMILQSRLRRSGSCPAIQVSKLYDDLPLVECHPSQVNQVFLNLLNNAIDAIRDRVAACPDGPPDFQPRLDVCTQKLEGGWVQVQITDNGAGIPYDIQSKLFDPFFSSKPVGSGTGLGLFVGYQVIVEQHGGELTFTSTPGEGSAFSIKLPIRLQSQSIASHTESADATSPVSV
ncbi:ATP-binding protein [Vacuolonema iberomarrocanum]|uniref:ATP-binding protein n=1 Tax=Vacuolonema iberomarrocanum TaxID=3454632 RepID=UPI0019F64081|nr:HAMP domain-containing protein [filamentous cyanobacterium LEGE 07170]